MGDAHARRCVRARGAARRRGDDDARPLPIADVVLYHAQGCHLCERARSLVTELKDELGFDLREVDIGGDPSLEERYREWLPVVEIGGERAFVYYVQPDAFRRKLAQSRGRTGS